MEHFLGTNISLSGFSTERPYVPQYFSSHSGIPHILIHELAVAWMITGVVLNGFLIYYLMMSRKYRSPVFMLVLFLAMADFLSCLTLACLAGFIWPIYRLPMHTWMLCKTVCYVSAFVVSGSPYYLVLFAALRFYQLCFPLKARARVTSNFVRNWCLLIMFVEMVGWSPFFFSYNLIDVNYDGKRSVLCIYTGKLLPVQSIAFLAVNTFIPGISIPVLHLMKYIGVSRRRHCLETQKEQKNTDIRALMIIIVMFYICWFPLNIYGSVYRRSPNHGPAQDNLLLLFIFGNGSNNALNPVVYCLAANSVRSDIAQLLCKKKVAKAKQHSK